MKLLIIATLLVAMQTLRAEKDSSYAVYHTEELSVTDTRTGIELKDLGKQVEVITQEEIGNMPVNSIDELLRFVPGVEVQSRGLFGTQADISMRGGTFSQTLVLLDGMRIGDPMTGHFNSNLPVSLSSIRRIEIIKGASSSIYGADAVGGVINIVTYGLSDFVRFENPRVYTDFPHRDTTGNGVEHSLLGVTVGDYSTYQLNAFIPISTEDVYFDLGYTYSSSYGYPAFDNTHNYGFDIHTGGASLNFKLAENDFLAFRLAADIRDFDARYFYTASNLDKSKEKVSRFLGQTKLQIGSFANHTIIANLGLIYTEDNFVFNPAFTANNHFTVVSDMNLHDQIELTEDLGLTVGAELQANRIRSNDRGNRHQEQLGLYVAGLYEVSQELSLNAGLREEYLPTKNWELVPSLGATYYASEGVKLRANAGKSIRTPDYTERYVSTGLPGVLSKGRNLGNPDLKPEVSWNYELGADFQLQENVSLSVTGYLRNSENIIDYGFKKGSEIENNAKLDTNFEYLYAQNIASLDVSGVEFKLSGQLASKSLNWYLGGSLLEISVADSVSSKYISNAAGINFSMGVLWAIGKHFKLSADAIYRKRDISEAQSIEFGLTDEYFVMDGKLSYSWEAISLELTAKNIFDKDYSDILGVQLPGRWLMLGVRISDNIFVGE